ncbi:MAG TPA: phytanoyl-CoA dioxygenase family protein [Flavobacterium sp.]|nr:phytanoyl-CoA dioxygenase family protein [Flavobacterium sp.]
MRQVLNDPRLEQQFDKDGYVIVDLLSQQELQEIRNTFRDFVEEGKRGLKNVESSYKLSFFNSDGEYRSRVLQTIADFFQAKVDKYLKGYKPLIINLFDKEPGGGEVPIHQNWTFVDERKYTSVSVWIPLQDVSRENGTLEVVKGSHRVLTDFRSPTIPWVFEDLFTELKEKYLQPLNLTAGQVGIIDDSIIHWSSENKTNANRAAIQLIMVPEEAVPLHYYMDPAGNKDKLEVFEVDAGFFTTFNMLEKPKNVKSIGYIDFKPFKYTEEEMVEIIAKNNPAIRGLATA